jgi:hypothetical protein
MLRAKLMQIQSIIGAHKINALASGDAAETFARTLLPCELPRQGCDIMCNGEVEQLKDGAKVHVRFEEEGWYEGVYFNEQVWFQDGDISNIRLVARWHLAHPVPL